MRLKHGPARHARVDGREQDHEAKGKKPAHAVI